MLVLDSPLQGLCLQQIAPSCYNNLKPFAPMHTGKNIAAVYVAGIYCMLRNFYLIQFLQIFSEFDNSIENYPSKFTPPPLPYKRGLKGNPNPRST